MEKDGSKLAKKLQAIKIIVTELEKLDEDERGDVISFALKQVGIEGYSDSKPLVAGSVSPDFDPGKSGEVDHLPLDQFVKSKKPANEYQRIAVIAYHIERKDGKKEFKNAELSEANIEARQPKIANITAVMSKAQERYKFFTKGAGKATHQLSTHGTDIVEALPDLGKVKELMAESKTRVTKKKKAKNKK